MTAGLGLGLALAALRQAAGLTVDEVAAAADVSPVYLAAAERGDVTPTAGWCAMVADVIAQELVPCRQ